MTFFLLSLRSASSISSMSSLTFFACSSSRSRFSRAAVDSFGGGRRAAVRGSEGERLLRAALIWEMNVAETELVLGGGRRGGDVGEGYYVNVPWSSPRSSQAMIELSDGRSVGAS